VWVANGQSAAQIIPKGMLVGNAQALQGDGAFAISDAKTSKRETVVRQEDKSVDYSSMTDLNLTAEQIGNLLKLLKKFSDVFDESRRSIVRKGPVKHRVNTADDAPVSQRAYRVSPTERRIIQQEVEKVLAKDIIQTSENQRLSRVDLVQEKHGSWRFCVDYRRFNKITKKDVHPLPRIDEALDCLKEATFSSSMYLLSGYGQIEVDLADREKTAFITPEGL